jgi:hypothetical protein
MPVPCCDVQSRLERLTERQLALYRSGDWRAADALTEKRLDLERRVARREGRPFAEVLDWQPRWSGGAPLPHLLTNGHRTFLSYYVQDDPATGHDEPIAVVAFEGCIAASLGPPNDETLHGHPLNGSGLRMYEAHVVHRSPWLAELEATNAVHRCHDPARWATYSHYLLVFHDEVFQCVASSYVVESTTTAPLGEVLAALAARLAD